MNYEHRWMSSVRSLRQADHKDLVLCANIPLSMITTLSSFMLFKAFYAFYILLRLLI